MNGPMLPIAVGNSEFQEVEPIPPEPTANFLNSAGGYQSTFGGTTKQVLPLLIITQYVAVLQISCVTHLDEVNGGKITL